MAERYALASPFARDIQRNCDWELHDVRALTPTGDPVRHRPHLSRAPGQTRLRGENSRLSCSGAHGYRR